MVRQGREPNVVDEGGTLSPAGFAWLGIAALFCAYLATFALTRPEGFAAHLWRASYNTLPVVPLVFGLHALLVAQVWPRRVLVALAVQLPLALTFAYVWYLGIIVLRALPGDWAQGGFAVEPFVPIALIWQMFQGMTVYAVIALASLALHLHATRIEGEREEEATRRPAALLVKTGNEHEAVELTEIVRISGAGDYSELVLQGRSLLSNSSLAELESRLPEGVFFRAHRSHIVRTGAIRRAEPAGNGRTTLHLEDGDTIVTSRSGTRLLRESAV